MRVHVLATVVVASLAVAYAVIGLQLAIVVTMIAVILAFETMNTAIEMLCDLVATELKLGYPDERIKNIKDLSTGAVLVAAICAALVGGIVFLPYIA
jgi:diacylglycerol kinase (ATP)